ncbi:basic helix-loop-helix (bHLH) DNA-binding superfamily protein [Actinidia rufa]|uniref:Basic helix-loop-helix (BHLH) DNA-binding superfamily protein n=1 Tax=Actinidia rufa TaxID=165716 RepID=A0A7J0GNV0_9ERIC|nr:basic helix-loop-helix (bHLH) DNA-binding superfamily protein [Actinidia rufa]
MHSPPFPLSSPSFCPRVFGSWIHGGICGGKENPRESSEKILHKFLHKSKIQTKAEKIELRDEKQRLKAEKEKLEQQVKTMNGPQPGFLHPIPGIPLHLPLKAKRPANKLVPIISYPGVAMWQFMPPAAVDTSQDHVLRPPVA